MGDVRGREAASCSSFVSVSPALQGCGERSRSETNECPSMMHAHIEENTFTFLIICI